MNARLKQEVNFSSIIFDGPAVFPNKFHVEFNLITETDSTPHQNIAMQRILFFIYNILDDCIMININHPNLNKLKKISNGTFVVELPGEPRDQLIGILLYHKLYAITDDKFEIENLIIGSERFDKLSYTIEDFGDFGIEGVPWWDREDLTICERKNHELVKLTWKDIDLEWDSEEKTDNKKNNIEILDGGPEKENDQPATK